MSSVSRRAINVLYVESGRGEIGGSMVSLLTLVRHLDRSAYSPRLLLFDDILVRRDFETIGCPVTLWDDVTTLSEDRLIGETALASRQLASRIGLRSVHALAAGLYRILGNDLPLALRFCRLVTELNADLVHTNDRVRSNAFAVYGALLARRPVVVHERWLYGYSWSDRLASRFVSALCCVSRAVRDSALAAGARPRKIFVLHNPVEIPRQAVQAARPPGVSFLGRLVPWKGVELFVEACGLLARRYPDVRFTVAGGDPSPGEAFLAHLKTKASERGLDGRIEFTGTIRDIGELLERTSVLVHASTEPEPFGRTVIEGMAHGVAVVAARQAGPTEIIDHGQTGLLVEPGSVEAIVAAVQYLLDHPEKSLRLGRAARRVAMERFLPEAHAKKMMRIYKEVLEDRERLAA